jgi:hypothetical protein
VFQSGLTAPPLDHAAIAQAMLHAKARVCASPVVATTTAVTPNGKDHSRSLVHEVIRKILMAVSQAILAGRNSGLIDQGHNPQRLWDMGPPVLRKRPSLHRHQRRLFDDYLNDGLLKCGAWARNAARLRIVQGSSRNSRMRSASGT